MDTTAVLVGFEAYDSIANEAQLVSVSILRIPDNGRKHTQAKRQVQSSHIGFPTINSFENIRSATQIVLITRHTTWVTISHPRIEFR